MYLNAENEEVVTYPSQVGPSSQFQAKIVYIAATAELSIILCFCLHERSLTWTWQ